MTPEVRILSHAGEALLRQWDPSGAAGTPSVRDAHRGHVPRAAALAEAGTIGMLAEHPHGVETKDNWIAADLRHCEDAVGLLVGWRGADLLDE